MQELLGVVVVPVNCRDQQLDHVDGKVSGVREEGQVPGADAWMRP